LWDDKNPTVQMMGRFQPWHDGHMALFRRAVEKTGQVCVMVRDCDGDNNPFPTTVVVDTIHRALADYVGRYRVVVVPNIVDITYGRDVGYTMTREHLGAELEAISATAIRRKMCE